MIVKNDRQANDETDDGSVYANVAVMDDDAYEGDDEESDYHTDESDDEHDNEISVWNKKKDLE